MAGSFSSFRKLRTSGPPYLKFHPHLQPRPHQHFLSPPPRPTLFFSLAFITTQHATDFTFLLGCFSPVKAEILDEGREFCLCVHRCLPCAPRTMSGTCKLSKRYLLTTWKEGREGRRSRLPKLMVLHAVCLMCVGWKKVENHCPPPAPQACPSGPVTRRQLSRPGGDWLFLSPSLPSPTSSIRPTSTLPAPPLSLLLGQTPTRCSRDTESP